MAAVRPAYAESMTCFCQTPIDTMSPCADTAGIKNNAGKSKRNPISMKRYFIRLLIPCLFTAVCVAQQPAASPAPAASPSSTASPAPADPNAEKAKKLLNQMIAAMGGNKFLTYTNVMQKGRSAGFYHGRPTGEDSEFWAFSQYPDKERIELTPQRDIIELYNGDKGWEVTYKGAHELPEDDLKLYLQRREYRIDAVLRVWLKDPAVALFYDGSDIVEAQPVEKITILNGKNQGVTLMVDSNSHLLIKKQYTLRDAQGYRDEEADIYANYHFIDGFATAYTILHTHNGDISGERFLSQVTYNEAVPADFFTPEGAVVGKKKKKDKDKK